MCFRSRHCHPVFLKDGWLLQRTHECLLSSILAHLQEKTSCAGTAESAFGDSERHFLGQLIYRNFAVEGAWNCGLAKMSAIHTTSMKQSLPVTLRAAWPVIVFSHLHTSKEEMIRQDVYIYPLDAFSSKQEDSCV